MESESQQLRQLTQRFAELVATAEAAELKMHVREQTLERKCNDHITFVNSQLDRMQQLLKDYESVMTEAGVARWRLAAENNLQQGRDHLQAMQATIEEFKQLTGQTCDRLDRTTNYAIKGISDAMNSVRFSDFKQLTEESCHRVEFTANSAVRQIAKVAHWFYWKKTLLVFLFSSAVAVIFGLYVNAEWPWEMHGDVINQRQMGHAAMKAWPQLHEEDKKIIAQYQQEDKNKTV